MYSFYLNMANSDVDFFSYSEYRQIAGIYIFFCFFSMQTDISNFSRPWALPTPGLMNKLGHFW